MRVRNLFATGLAMVVASSCSNSAPGITLDEATLDAELELALFNGGGRQAPMVTSAVELTQTPEQGAAPRAVRSPRPRLTAPPPVEVVANDAAVEEATEVVADVAPAPAPVVEEPVAVVASAPGEEEGHLGHGGASSRGEGRGTVIIRGGGVSGRDPCVIHRPGSGPVAGGDGILGTIGILINDRIPGIGGMGAGGSGYPGGVGYPSGGGRTSLPQPRGGGAARFPGGIR